jgi:hypothetical protein
MDPTYMVQEAGHRHNESSERAIQNRRFTYNCSLYSRSVGLLLFAEVTLFE